jgi:predicted site-specific integrase-resolvase
MHTLKEAAKMIGVPYNSVLFHHKKGRIPVRKVGHYQLIEPEVLRSVLTALHYRQRQK